MVEYTNDSKPSFILRFLPRNLSYAEEGFLDSFSVCCPFIRTPKRRTVLRNKLGTSHNDSMDNEIGDIDQGNLECNIKVAESSKFTECGMDKCVESDIRGGEASDTASEEGVFVNMLSDVDSVGSPPPGSDISDHSFFSIDSINSPDECDAVAVLTELVSEQLRNVSPNGDVDGDSERDEQNKDECKKKGDTKIATLKIELKDGSVSEFDTRKYLLEGTESPVYDEPEFNFSRTELRKSSSLKSKKTPPGTPSRKKMVRFADAMGLDLEDVRHVIDQEQPPRIPPSAMADLRVGMEAERQCTGSRYLDLCFPQPGAHEHFVARILAKKVALENCIVTDISITGVVRVANIGFHKIVRIRYTINNWVSFYDVMASYIQKSCDGPTDRFSFTMVAPASVGPGTSILFAVSFTVNDTVYWDNNDGQNYRVVCYAKTTPTEVEEGWLHFV